MKRILSLLLILVSVLLSMQVAFAEEVPAATLNFTETKLTVLDKFSLKAKDFVAMSDGSALPKDLKFTVSDAKTASVHKTNGLIKAKKPGAVTVTVSSKKLGQSAACAVTVLENVFTENRDWDTLLNLFPTDGPKHNVFVVERKAYFNKNGKLTVDLDFCNRFGYDVTKIYKFKMYLYNSLTEKKISTFSKSTVTTRVLGDRESFYVTYSFPKGGLASSYDLTNLYEDGSPVQYSIGYDFYFYHDADEDDPWGEWDDYSKNFAVSSMAKGKRVSVRGISAGNL